MLCDTNDIVYLLIMILLVGRISEKSYTEALPQGVMGIIVRDMDHMMSSRIIKGIRLDESTHSVTIIVAGSRSTDFGRSNRFSPSVQVESVNRFSPSVHSAI